GCGVWLSACPGTAWTSYASRNCGQRPDHVGCARPVRSDARKVARRPESPTAHSSPPGQHGKGNIVRSTGGILRAYRHGRWQYPWLDGTVGFGANQNTGAACPGAAPGHQTNSDLYGGWRAGESRCPFWWAYRPPNGRAGDDL